MIGDVLAEQPSGGRERRSVCVPVESKGREVLKAR